MVANVQFSVSAGSFDLRMRFLIDVYLVYATWLPATDLSLDVGWSARIRQNVRLVKSGRNERFLVTADGRVLFRRTRVVM